MLERVPATAESAAHLFLRNFDRPCRSARVLDSRFWQSAGTASSSSSAWWPQYLQQVRQIAEAVEHSPSVTSIAKVSTRGRCGTRTQHAPITPVPAQLRRYTVSSSTLEQQPKEKEEPEGREGPEEQEEQAQFYDPFFSSYFESQESQDQDALPREEQQRPMQVTHQDRDLEEPRLPPSGRDAFSDFHDEMVLLRSQRRSGTIYDEQQQRREEKPASMSIENNLPTNSNVVRNVIERQLEATQNPAEYQPFEGEPEVELQDDQDEDRPELPFKHLRERTFPRPKSIVTKEMKQPNHKSVSLQEFNPSDDAFEGAPYRKLRRNWFPPQEPRDLRHAARLREREFAEYTQRMEEDNKDYEITLNSPVKRLPPRRDPTGVQLNELLLQSTTSAEGFRTAWQLFIKLPDQEAHATELFHYLARAEGERNTTRALEAWRLIPRLVRTRDDYDLAVNLKLRLHQHQAAINIALEFHAVNPTTDFSVAQNLLLHLLNGRLWVNAAELLHRIDTAHRDFGQLADRKSRVRRVSKYKSAPSKQLIEVLRSSASSDKQLFQSVLNLTEWIRSTQASYLDTDLRESLMTLIYDLSITFATSRDVLSQASTSALLALVGVHDLFPDLRLHNRVLTTLLKDAKERSLVCESALVVYRNMRFSTPDASVKKPLLGMLLSAFAQIKCDVALYDYFLDEFRALHHTPDRKAYQLVLTACGRQGRLDLVERHLQACIQDCSIHAVSMAHLSPLVYACAVNGDASGAEKQFQRIQFEFKMELNTIIWNVLLLAYSRSRNDMMAFQVFERMQATNVRIDEVTLATLLNIAANHINLDLATSLIQEAQERELKVTVPMLTALTTIYLAQDNVAAALSVIRVASQAKTGEPLNHMWNLLLRYYANHGDSAGITRTRAEMQTYGVKPDEMSYAAVISLLIGRREVSQAYIMLQDMHRIVPTFVKPLHYALVLSGYVREKNRNMIVRVAEEMQHRMPTLDTAAGTILAVLRGSRDISEETHISVGKLVVALLTARQNAQSTRFDPGETRALSTVAHMYFDTFFQAMLQSGSFDAAEQLLRELRILQKDADALQDIGMKVSLASMDLAIARGSQRALDREWKILYGKVKTAVKSEASMPGQVPKDWKTCLSRPLNKYMDGLASAGRLDELTHFLTAVYQRQGFLLTGRNLNKWVQVLCKSDNAQHRIRAFKIAEETLLNRAQNWNLLQRSLYREKSTQEFFSTDNKWGRSLLDKRTSYTTTDRNLKIDLHKDMLIPTYATMIHLGAALSLAQRDVAGNYSELTEINEIAPKTKKFVQQMPYIPDRIQGQVLRNNYSRDETQSLKQPAEVNPRKHESLLDQIPAQYLSNIEELLYPEKARFKNLFGIDDDLDMPAADRVADIALGEKFFGQINRDLAIRTRFGREEQETQLEAIKRVEREEGVLLRKIRALRDEVQKRQPGRRRYSETLSEPLLQPSVDELKVHMPRLERAAEARLSQFVYKTAPPAPQLIPATTFSTKPGESKVRRPVKALDFVERRRLRRRTALKQRQEEMSQVLSRGLDNYSERTLLPRTAAATRRLRFERAKARQLEYATEEVRTKAGKRAERPVKTERGLLRKFASPNAREFVRLTSDLKRKDWRYLVRKGAINIPKTSRLSVLSAGRDSRFKYNFTQQGRLIGRVKQKRRFEYLRAKFGLPPKEHRVPFRGSQWNRLNEQQKVEMLQTFREKGFEFRYPVPEFSPASSMLRKEKRLPSIQVRKTNSDGQARTMSEG